jgi:methionyl-tRNA formyltransferase
MYMAEKLDAGDILTQVEVPITETDNVGTLHDKLSAAGARLLSETVPKLLNGEISPVKQNDEEATFAWNIKREQEKIDWSKSGIEIFNHIRGMNPWPVAYSTLEGTVVKIWTASKIEQSDVSEPGEILSIEEDGFIVASGDHIAIKITELQPAGKKRMDAGQFLRGAGAQIHTGMMLGEKYEG